MYILIWKPIGFQIPANHVMYMLIQVLRCSLVVHSFRATLQRPQCSKATLFTDLLRSLTTDQHNKNCFLGLGNSTSYPHSRLKEPFSSNWSRSKSITPWPRATGSSRQWCRSYGIMTSIVWNLGQTTASHCRLGTCFGLIWMFLFSHWVYYLASNHSMNAAMSMFVHLTKVIGQHWFSACLLLTIATGTIRTIHSLLPCLRNRHKIQQMSFVL